MPPLHPATATARFLRRLSPVAVTTGLLLAACGPGGDPTGPMDRGPAAAGAEASVAPASAVAIPITAILDLRARVTRFHDGEGVASVVFDGATSEGQSLTGKGTVRFTAETGPWQDTLLLETAELRFRGTLGPDGSSVDVRGQGSLDLEDILIPRAGIVFLPITEFKGELLPR